MKCILMSLVLSLSTLSFAKEKKAEHRELHAHTHGSATMSMAFDGPKGRIEFASPAESILGFEYEPKTAKDKETLQNMVKTFISDFSKMVQFDASLMCVFLVEKVEQKMESKSSKHSNFIVNFNVQCAKKVTDSKINFNFSRFEKLKDIDVTILADKFQKNLEISNKESSTELQ